MKKNSAPMGRNPTETLLKATERSLFRLLSWISCPPCCGGSRSLLTAYFYAISGRLPPIRGKAAPSTAEAVAERLSPRREDINFDLLFEGDRISRFSRIKIGGLFELILLFVEDSAVWTLGDQIRQKLSPRAIGNFVSILRLETITQGRVLLPRAVEHRQRHLVVLIEDVPIFSDEHTLNPPVRTRCVLEFCTHLFQWRGTVHCRQDGLGALLNNKLIPHFRGKAEAFHPGREILNRITDSAYKGAEGDTYGLQNSNSCHLRLYLLGQDLYASGCYTM